MKEGGGALQASSETHHVGKKRDDADGENVCLPGPVDETLSVGNGSGDLEDSRKEEGRTFAEERIKETSLQHHQGGQEDGQLCTNAEGPRPECGVESQPKLCLPQPQEANATAEEPSSEFTCKSTHIPEESSDRTTPEQGAERTSSDADPCSAKEISVACGYFKSGLSLEELESKSGKLGEELVDQKDALSSTEEPDEKSERLFLATEGDKCTSVGKKSEKSVSESLFEKPDEALLKLGGAEISLKSVEDQVSRTPNLEKCKESVKKSLDRNEQEESCDESLGFEGSMRVVEEGACRIEYCASASEVDNEPKDNRNEDDCVREENRIEVHSSEREERLQQDGEGDSSATPSTSETSSLTERSDVNLCEDTLGSIISVEISGKEGDALNGDSCGRKEEEPSWAVLGNHGVEPEESALTKNEFLTENAGADVTEGAPDRRIPLHEDKTSAEEKLNVETAKDNKFFVDVLEEKDLEVKNKGSLTTKEQGASLEEDKEDLVAENEVSPEEENVLIENDKGDFLADEGLSLESVSETSFSLNDITEDGKDVMGEDTQESTVVKTDFMAELEDISSEDEDFFAEMESISLASNKDCVTEREAVSLDLNEGSLVKREAVSGETNDHLLAENMSFSSDENEKKLTEIRPVSLDGNNKARPENKTASLEENEDGIAKNNDSLSGKVAIPLEVSDDFMIGTEAVSSDETEDSLAEMEAISTEISGESSTEKVDPVSESNDDSLSLKDAVLLDNKDDLLSDKEAVSLESTQDILGEKGQDSLERGANEEDEVEIDTVGKHLATLPGKTDFLEKSEDSLVVGVVAVDCKTDSVSTVEKEMSRILKEDKQADHVTPAVEYGSVDETVSDRSLPTNTEPTPKNENGSSDEASDNAAEIAEDSSNESLTTSLSVVATTSSEEEVAAASDHEVLDDFSPGQQETASRESKIVKIDDGRTCSQPHLVDNPNISVQAYEQLVGPAPFIDNAGSIKSQELADAPVSESTTSAAVDVPEATDAPVQDKKRVSPALPSGINENSALLPAELEERSTPQPSDVGESLSSQPSEECGSSAPQPSEEDESFASEPFEDDESYATQPSAVPKRSALQPSEGDENSALQHSEEDESSVPQPSENGDSFAPQPSKDDDSSAPQPSEDDDSSAPQPSEEYESSASPPSELQEISASLLSEVEDSLAPQPLEEASPPVSLEVGETSARAPSEERENLAMLPADVEESSTLQSSEAEGNTTPHFEEEENSVSLPPEVEKDSVPLLSEVEDSSVPLPPHVQDSPAPLLPEVKESSPALPPEVDGSSSPLPPEVKGSSAPLPLEVEGSSAPLPPEGEESSSPLLSEVEENSVGPPPEVEENSVSLPLEVEENSVPLPPEVEESSLSLPTEVEESSLSLPTEVEGSSALQPSDVEKSLSPSPAVGKQALPPSAVEESSKSLPEEAEKSSAVLQCQLDTESTTVLEDVSDEVIAEPKEILLGKGEQRSHKAELETSPADSLAKESTSGAETTMVSEIAVAGDSETGVADNEIVNRVDPVAVERDATPVTAAALEKLVQKTASKSLKKERCPVKNELDIPLGDLKQEELDIPSEPLDDDDLDGPDYDDDDSFVKMEGAVDGESDSFDETALVIDEGDDPPKTEINKNSTLLKTEALRSLGSEVSIKLVPAKGSSESREKPKEVQSISIIPKENLLNMSDDLKRRRKAQSLVMTSSTVAPSLTTVPTKVSKSSPRAPIPDLTPLQTELAKTTKAVGRTSKSASTLKKSEQNKTVKSLLKGPSPAGPPGNWPQKGKTSTRRSEDFRPFPSLPKDTVVIPTYYVAEQDKSQPMNLSTSNDLPVHSKSIPASQPLPANVVPSQREKAVPLTMPPPRGPPTKNVLPPSASGPPPLPIQSMMPKMDNNMFPAMWNLFGPQLLSSQFLAAAAGASGTLPPFPMDPQKQNLLGAMLAASSAMPRLPMPPIPPEINIYNTALMQMQAQMDAFMPPKLPEHLQNAPLPPDMNRYNAALMQMQAQMEAYLPPQMPPPMSPSMPPSMVPPMTPPMAPPAPPFVKSNAPSQMKPQATIHPQPKVPQKPVQLGNLAQSAVDRKTAQPAVPRKPGGRNTKFTPGSSPRLVKRPTSAAATAVAAALKIPVPAVNPASRPSVLPTAKPAPAATTPAASKKFKLGSKINSVVDKLKAGAGKQSSAADWSSTAPPIKSSSPVPPRKDTPPLKDAAPVKKVIQVTNALTIELENRSDSRDRRVRPPMPALLPCKPTESPSAPCEVILVDDAKRAAIAVSRGASVNGCVSDVISERAVTPPQVVLTPEQARKSVEVKRQESSALTMELLSREAPSSNDDPMSVTCSLPLDKVSVMLDTVKKSPAPGCPELPTLPPTLAAGGLEILPMEIANTATSTPKQVVPDTPVGANSINLGSNVSLTLTATPAPQEGEWENPLEQLSAVEPCSPVAQDDPTMEPTPSPPRLEPVSSPIKGPSGVQDGETPSPDKEVPSLDLEVPEGLDSSRKTPSEDAPAVPPNSLEETPVASSKTLAARKKFSFRVTPSFMMTLSDGQKLFTCDICSGVYQRSFSLKRHYLRSHINYIHLQERDISNCGIIVGNKMAVQTEPNTTVCLKDSKITVVSTDEEIQECTNVVGTEDENDLNLPGLYRCYTCGVCFDLKEQLRSHLAEHRPSCKPDSQEEESSVPKETMFTCEVCAYPFRHKKNYVRHIEVCSKRKQTPDQSEWLCLFCNKTFSSAVVRSRHLSCIHRRLRPGLKKSRRSKVQKHSCMYCGTAEPKFNDLNSLLKHMCTSHKDVYFGCLLCEERYPSKSELQEHRSATHEQESVTVEAPEVPEPDVLEPEIPEPEVPEPEEELPPAENPPPAEKPPPAEQPKGKSKKSDAFQFVCSVCKKMFVNEMNMKRHKQLAHGGPRGKKKRRAGNTAGPLTPPTVPDASTRRKEAEGKLDPEALFYSRLSMQIRENLTHHLDGKLDSQELFEREEEQPLVVKDEEVPALLPNPAASARQEQAESGVDPHKVKNIPRRRSSESYLRLTWDKFNINKDKDSRNSVSSFIRDMSHIDIPTQLVMRRNMKRLSGKDATTVNMRTNDDEYRLEYPSCIALTRSAEGSRSLGNALPESLVNSMLSVTKRVNTEEPSTSTSTATEPPPKIPMNPAEDFLNGPWKNRDLSNEVVELSGEWVRPKHYLCAACDSAFLDNLYEMEDHQYLMHPNVWGTYWEFEESTLVPFRAAGIKSPCSLYQRSLKPTGSLISAPPHPASQTKDIACTKCSRLNHSVPELHRHMLDCGGDTTWHLTMVLSSPVNGRRNRKWRPFGSRRRRQQGRRGLKRNIPNTPQRPKTNQPKTRGGDAETIQRMIANLPAKRSTRRVIQFKEDEVKTRSQATIASSRLLRKRFKVPFPVSQSPLHKASRAILGRSMASSSSKPGHMPRARPLRVSTTSATSAASAIAAVAATTLKASKVQSPPKSQPQPQQQPQPQPQPQEVAHTMVQVQTLIPAKVKKMAKVLSKIAKPGKSKVSPNTLMEPIPSTSKISVEDIPEDMLDSPGKGEKNTDVILEAMRQAMMSANFHACGVCGRMFNNSGNRDRHSRVCAAQAEEGMPRLRKEALAPRSRQVSKNGDIPVLSPNASSGDSPKSKSAKSVESQEVAEPPSAEASGSGKKKKKRTIVGIRKSLVKSEESGGSMVVSESFLVRVESSSNETSEAETKEKAEDELSDDVFDKAVETPSPKKKESKKKGAKRPKGELTIATPAEEKKKKKKTKLANQEEAPVKKLTRSKQASPQKVPVMRVDRSLNPDIVSGVEVAVPGTVGRKPEDLPAEGDQDNLDFEELLNTMDAEEIKQLDMIVSETPSSDADDDIPLGEKIPIWKKEAEALGVDPVDLIPLKPKKGSKKRSMDADLPATKKTRSSSVFAEDMVEAVVVEEEESNPAAKSSVIAKTLVPARSAALTKARRNKSLQETSTLMLPPSIQEPPPISAKSRRRSSVMKVDPPVIVPEPIPDAVDEPKVEDIPMKVAKKKTKASKAAENVANVIAPSQDPEEVILSGKKKTKTPKQAESVAESEPAEVQEPLPASKKKTKAAKSTEVPVQPKAVVVKGVKPTTKRKPKGAAKVAEKIPTEVVVEAEEIPTEVAVEAAGPVSKKKGKSAKPDTEADLAEVKPPTKKKIIASKLIENIVEPAAVLVEQVKPVSKRKSKAAAKLVESVAAPVDIVAEPAPELVAEEKAPVPIAVEPVDAAVVSSSVSTLIPKKKKKKKSKAEAIVAENALQPEPVMTQEVPPPTKKKSKLKSAASIVNPESGALAEDVKQASKKKTKSVPKPTDVVIEPDPNLVGELTPRNRKRIQPLDGDTKKTKGKPADKHENPPSPAVAPVDAPTPPPVTAKKGKVVEEPTTITKEASPFKEPAEIQPVKRKQKKRVSIQPVEGAEEKIDVLPESPSPKVNRKRSRSSLAEDDSKPAAKGRGKKKAKLELDANLGSSVVEEPVPDEVIQKPKGGKKKNKAEPEEPLPAVVDPPVTPVTADVQSKPKKKSKQTSKTNVEPVQVAEDLLQKESEPNPSVTPVNENEQVSECAVAPTASTPMDPPAANSPTPGEQPDVTPKKRKSSIGSQFFCDLCQRHYSTAYNLTKHLSSLSHRALLRGTQSSEIVAASGESEGKPCKSEDVPKTEETFKADDSVAENVAVVDEIESNEQPFLDKGKDPLKDPALQTSDIVGSESLMDDKADSVVTETTNTEIQAPTQSEETLVQNKPLEEEAEEVAVPQQTQLEEETPKNSEEPNQLAEEQLQEEPVPTEHQSSLVTAAEEPEKTPEPVYTPLDPVKEVNQIPDETLPVPSPAQASLVQDQNQFQDYAPTPPNPVQEIHHHEYTQEQSYSEQQYNCYEPRSWQGADGGWGPWRIPDSADDMSSNVGFGLGSILDSVNQVLAGEGGVASDLADSVYAGYALNEIQNAVGATDEEMAVLRQLGEGSFEELVGAPGSVMWPPAEEAQLLDLDNQRPNQPPESEKAPAEIPLTPLSSRKSSKSPAPSTSGAPTPTKTPHGGDAIPGPSSRDDTRSPVSMMPRSKTVQASGNSLNELYEDRQMWCPSCHRRFLGLQAMKAHMAQHHSQNQRVERKATLSAEGSSEHRIICEVCREMVVDQVALELHMEELHSGHSDPSKAVPASPSPGAKSRVLRMQMSHALGGLLDRALKNYLSKSTTGTASSVDTDRSRFTLGLLNKLALRHQANSANQRESPRSTPNPLENDGDGASSHSGSTTPTNMGPKRRNSRTEPMFVQYQGHPCPHCPEKFMSDAFVRRHINNVHANLFSPDPAEDNFSDPESRATSPMEFCADPVVGDDGAFLCSSCGINFKSPSEVLEHQRVQHPQPSPEELAKSAAENEEYVKPDTPIVRVNESADLKADDDDLDSAEIAEKVSEFQQRVTNPLKGRSLLTKELKNKKIALAVESALLEHTAEVQVIAEAALRELGPCRKSSKSSTKESPKWGIDAVKFTVAKEPALIGAYGPMSEQESRLRNIPIVRKTPSSAPRFSFAERKKFPKPSTEVKPFKEKMEIYEFDESPRVEPLTFELKREVEDKSNRVVIENKDEIEERRSTVSDEVQELQPPKPVEVSPVKVEPVEDEASKKAPTKRRQSSAKRKEAPGKDEGGPSKVAKVEKKKIFKKRKSDQGESSKISEGSKSRVPRFLAEKGDSDSSGRVRKQRRASTHDATDYSVFDFSSDESSMGAVVDASTEASGTSGTPTSPRARRESVSPPKKATPSRVQELVEEDWTWLDDSESEKEKRKKMARRKRTKKKMSDSPKKQCASRESTEEMPETSRAPEEGGSGSGGNKRRKRTEAPSGAAAGSSGEGAR